MRPEHDEPVFQGLEDGRIDDLPPVEVIKKIPKGDPPADPDHEYILPWADDEIVDAGVRR